jgi:hypothetical protein
MTRFIFLHYHVFKNAGSTIEEILHRSFFEKFARLDFDPFDHAVTNADLLSFLEHNPQTRALSSHQIRYPLPAAPGYVFFDLCFLRDPIDRVRSMYQYFREKPRAGEPVSDLANRTDLGGFIAGLVDRLQEWANDVQVNLLAHRSVDDAPPQEKDLDRAIETMLKTSWLGVVDCFHESLIAGQHFLSPVFPSLDCAQPPVNVSGGLEDNLAARIGKLRDACGERVYAELLRLNALDLELMKRARAEVKRRFEMVPDRAAKLAALEAELASSARPSSQ